jgi:hypothetical protein
MSPAPLNLQGLETQQTCPFDCSGTPTPFCGDAACAPPETAQTCPEVCQSVGIARVGSLRAPWNLTCCLATVLLTDNCANKQCRIGPPYCVVSLCPQDCGACNANGICDASPRETFQSCPSDCAGNMHWFTCGVVNNDPNVVAYCLSTFDPDDTRNECWQHCPWGPPGRFQPSDVRTTTWYASREYKRVHAPTLQSAKDAKARHTRLLETFVIGPAILVTII